MCGLGVVTSLYTRKARSSYVLCRNKLNDLHINGFQNLLKSQFMELDGLHNTLLQSKSHFLKADLDSNKNNFIDTLYARSLGCTPIKLLVMMCVCMT